MVQWTPPMQIGVSIPAARMSRVSEQVQSYCWLMTENPMIPGA